MSTDDRYQPRRATPEDKRPLFEPGVELQALFAERFGSPRRSGTVSVRQKAVALGSEEQAERLFRDFKMGLLTLVVVALILLAYFWDGRPETAAPAGGHGEGVLILEITGRPRSEVMPVRTLEMIAVAGGTAGRSRVRRAAARPRSYVYTVRRGDTLSRIASRCYGDARKWQTILSANRRRLRRPSDLRAGMKLLIPPTPSASSVSAS